MGHACFETSVYLSVRFKRETRYILYVCRYTCPVGQVMSKIFLLASKFHVQDFEAPDSRAEEVTEENSKIYIGKKD